MTRVYIQAGLRRVVYKRAGGKCEYCLLQEDDTSFTHHYEHVIPLRHGGATTANNLALACLECNLAKGTDLTTFDPLDGNITRLFSPRTDQWDEHFELKNAMIEGKTAIGRATVYFLRFNDPLRMIQRQALIRIGRYP
ncbi:MAG: HNH endonuclease [Anaerolineales bacterium]|nr:HNH endonuclease [Anaerolineales bacterium]